MSRIGAGMAKLVAGRGASVALGLASAPVIARLYAPGDFGLYGLLLAVAGWVAAFAGLAYPQAIPLARSRGEARTLVGLCLVLVSGLVGLTAVGLWVGGGLVVRLLGAPELRGWLWLVPLLVAALGLSQVGEYLLAWQRRYGLLAAANFGGVNAGRVLTILWGWLVGAGALGLVLGNLLGQVVLAACGILTALAWLLRPAGEAVSWREAARRHAQFPRLQLWNQVLQASAHNLPLMVFNAFFLPAQVGWFVFARNIVSLPLQLLGASAAQVFYPEAAREHQAHGTMAASITQTLEILALMCVLPLVAVALLGPLAFELVFGARWHTAGVYAQVLAPWILVNLLWHPVSTVFLVRGRAGALLAYSVAVVAVRSLAMAAGGVWGSPLAALGLFSAGGLVLQGYMLGRAVRLGGVGLRGVALPLLRELAGSLAVLAPAAAAYWLLGWRWFAVALAGAGAAGWWGWRLGRDARLRRGVRRLLSRAPQEED